MNASSTIMNYTTQTNEIAVAIKPVFLDKKNILSGSNTMLLGTKNSGPTDYFVWMYKIVITNDSDHPLTLISSELSVITENGLLLDIGASEQKDSNPVDKQITIGAKQAIEENNIITVACRSGIMYGKLIFKDVISNKKITIDILPIPLDSTESKKMAH